MVTRIREGSTVDQIFNEVILYGGLPLRRGDVYRDSLEATGSHKAAEMFACGFYTKLAPEGTQALTLREFQGIARRVSL